MQSMDLPNKTASLLLDNFMTYFNVEAKDNTKKFKKNILEEFGFNDIFQRFYKNK